jgi:hypothetical protein
MHRRHVSLGGAAYGIGAAGDDSDRDLELPKLVQTIERYPSFVSVPNDRCPAIDTGKMRPVPRQPGGLSLAAPAVRDHAGGSFRLACPNVLVCAGQQLRQASIAGSRHGGEAVVENIPVGEPASMACHDGNEYPKRSLTHNTNSRVGKPETGSVFWTSSRIDEWLETTARHGHVCTAVLCSNGHCPLSPGKN